MGLVPYKGYIRYDENEMQSRSESFYRLMDSRRSVREFSPEPLPRGVIENIIKTAGTSPSGVHCQPWRFVIVSNPEIKRRIRTEAEKIEKESYEKHFTEDWKDALKRLGTDWHKEFLEKAPCLIVVFQITGERDSVVKKNYYIKESVGIAVGILIAALHNAGLSSLTYTPGKTHFLNNILNRPLNEKTFMIIPAGYPTDGINVPDFKRKPLDEISVFID